jgi:S-adenosylmethionine synthetase
MRKAVESLFAGAPDKACDQIADAIVDEFLRRDPKAGVDISVLGSHGMLMIGGEIESVADFDLALLAKKTYAEIGYDDDVEVFVNVERPTEEMRVAPRGATDTVIVHGYATKETRELLPRPVVYAHTIARRLDDLRRIDPGFRWLRPDGKVQLVFEGERAVSATVLASHVKDINPREVQNAILERVVHPLVGGEGLQLYVNPLGAFTVDGFHADSGASGRRSASDTYGGLVPNGETGLSGKDPYKNVRAGTYMARYAARYLVEEGLADSAMVTVAYTMGRAEPVAVQVRGITEKSRGAKMDLTNVVTKAFDFRPEAVVERLGLLRPMYRQACLHGHFGRFGLPWEERAGEKVAALV